MIISLLPARTLAWGTTGHRVIARIATERLSNKARYIVNDLLGRGVTLESVANWADETRGARKGSDCQDRKCLIEAITENLKVLENYKESRVRRAEALKYIVNLIGDLHQPLHCVDNIDSSGRKKQVTFFGKRTNLFAVWDNDIVDRASKKNATVYARQLSAGAQYQTAQTAYTGGTITDWANESNNLARYAYERLNNTQLNDTYYNYARPIVENQLLRAGVRLAKILNDVLR